MKRVAQPQSPQRRDRKPVEEEDSVGQRLPLGVAAALLLRRHVCFCENDQRHYPLLQRVLGKHSQVGSLALTEDWW